MSKDTRWAVISLPSSICASNDKEEAFNALSSSVSDYGSAFPFPIPTFKIGTLDALVQQAEELSKLHGACEGVVSKIGDSLQGILDGDEERIAQQKTINDKPVDNYLQTFSWNKIKYRADKSVADLIDTLQRDISGLDNDIRAKFNQHNQVKTALTTAKRKLTGNLSTRSLAAVVPPSVLVRDSEYLETHLIAVPNSQTKDFLRSYETLAPLVVPRSAVEVERDSEFTLYAAVTFQKSSTEFTHRIREKRWTPRDYEYKEEGKEEEKREISRLAQEEKKVWGEALRLGRTGYSEAAMISIHVLVLRVFVETVLRYGLPLEFICGLIKTTPKLAKKIKAVLDTNYSYLGGNAFGRDKKGSVQKDDAGLSDVQMVGHADVSDYTAFVYYEFEIQ